MDYIEFAKATNQSLHSGSPVFLAVYINDDDRQEFEAAAAAIRALAAKALAPEQWPFLATEPIEIAFCKLKARPANVSGG